MKVNETIVRSMFVIKVFCTFFFPIKVCVCVCVCGHTGMIDCFVLFFRILLK